MCPNTLWGQALHVSERKTVIASASEGTRSKDHSRSVRKGIASPPLYS